MGPGSTTTQHVYYHHRSVCFRSVCFIIIFIPVSLQASVKQLINLENQIEKLLFTKVAALQNLLICEFKNYSFGAFILTHFSNMSRELCLTFFIMAKYTEHKMEHVQHFKVCSDTGSSLCETITLVVQFISSSSEEKAIPPPHILASKATNSFPAL